MPPDRTVEDFAVGITSALHPPAAIDTFGAAHADRWGAREHRGSRGCGDLAGNDLTECLGERG